MLKHLPDKMAMNILSKFTYGAQVEFYYNWAKWKTNLSENSEGNAPNYNEPSVLPIASTSTVIAQTTVNANAQTTANANVNLADILRCGPYGPGVVTYYQKLNDHIRKLLVEAFLYHCTTNEINVTKFTCQALSQQIVSAFKGEITVCKCKMQYNISIFIYSLKHFRNIIMCIVLKEREWVNCTTSSTIGKNHPSGSF